MSLDQTTYFAVIRWPDSINRDAVLEKITKRTGLDAATLRLYAKRAPPCIIGRFPIDVAQTAAETVVQCGGDAFCTTMTEIESLGATNKIKDLRIANGRLEADLWRGNPTTIAPADVRVLVRARLSESRRPDSFSSTPALGGLATLGQPSADLYFTYSHWGSYGLATAFAGDLVEEVGDTPLAKEVTKHEKLDIHVSDGRVFQIDGDKFGFRVLGELRGLSDNVNIDRLCDLFVHLAPEAVVDPFFSLWRAPIGINQLRLPQMKVNNDDPAFAFYSRWAALMYRHLLA